MCGDGRVHGDGGIRVKSGTRELIAGLVTAGAAGWAFWIFYPNDLAEAGSRGIPMWVALAGIGVMGLGLAWWGRRRRSR
jgi:drug/metabolite transporter (DMT)-like permease